MQRISLSQSFAAPVERVYAHLAEHENLGDVFGATITRVRDGHSERNGVGSVRTVKVNPLLPAVEETVTQSEPNALIEYRITGPSPLKDHVGVMRFSPEGAGSRLDYTIDFDGRVPGTGPVLKAVLERNVRRGLRDLATRLS